MDSPRLGRPAARTAVTSPNPNPNPDPNPNPNPNQVGGGRFTVDELMKKAA